MKLTRGQRIYGGVFALALAAFVVDRFVLGRTPDQALGSDTLLIASESTSPKGSLPRPSSDAGGSGPQAIARMLESLRSQRDIQPEQAHNAFTASWLKPREQQAPAPQGPDVETFVGHKLTSVTASGRKASIMIDGRILQVGQVLDGFKLISVDKQSALFESQGVRVRLTMRGESQVIR